MILSQRIIDSFCSIIENSSILFRFSDHRKANPFFFRDDYNFCVKPIGR
jgi:hypothetical protein